MFKLAQLLRARSKPAIASRAGLSLSRLPSQAMTYSARISSRPDLRRGSSVNFCEHRVKASETAESGEKSYFHHRLVGLIDEPLRSLNARRPCYRAGTRLQVPSEQASKLAAPHTEPLGKFVDRRTLLVERAILDDKPYRTLDRCPASDPGTGKWRGLGTAPQTRPEPRYFSSRGGRKKLNVSRPSRANGADRSTIDAGGPDSGEEPAVVPGITRDARALAFCNIQRHDGRP
jgi:hypothetical protein